MLPSVSKVQGKGKAKSQVREEMTLRYSIVPLISIVIYTVRKPDSKQVQVYIKQIVNSDRVRPILVDKDMHLLDGQCRWAAYKELGFEGIAIETAYFPETHCKDVKLDGNAHRDKMERKLKIIERKRKVKEQL